MKTSLKCLVALIAILSFSINSMAQNTLPLRGTVIKPSDPNIQYIGRISFANPDSPSFSWPGIQIWASFEGTSLKMVTKPGSGYFMAQIDNAEPFKVSLLAEKDSVATLATALPYGIHHVRLMYIIEGFQHRPEFRGFVLDQGCKLVSSPPLPTRKIEFIGNSITCGYGNEAMSENIHFDFSTENHYYSYAAITARALEAQHYVVARSGIGVYRHYNGPKTGSPDPMGTEYEYTNYQDKSEKWDFSRFQPDVICINLGTNDMSTNNYDVKLLRAAYVKFIQQVRSLNPKAKIVMLTGSMLNGKELELVRQTLDSVVNDYDKNGDREIYRFDMTPQNGNLLYGADWHPSYWQHEKMANELTSYLRTLMGWY